MLWNLTKINWQNVVNNSIYFLFYIPLLGTAVPSYIFILLHLFYYVFYKKSSKWGIMVGLMLFVFIIMKYSLLADGSQVGVLFRYFFGWIFVYLFLYYSKARVDINKFIMVYTIEILLEAFLVNAILSPDYFFNYPDKTHHRTAFMGFYQRVYSVGVNASISSTILALLYAYRDSCIKLGEKLGNKKIEILVFFSFLAFASGTGFCLYLILLLYRYNLLRPKTFIVGVLLFILLLILATTYAEQGSLLSRFSGIYMERLWELKSMQIEEGLDWARQGSLFLGTDYKGVDLQIYGDFALRDLFVSWGFVGLAILLIFSFRRMNKCNRIPVLIGILGLFHYGGIFCFPGQLCFAYALMLNKKTLSYYMLKGKTEKVFDSNTSGS